MATGTLTLRPSQDVSLNHALSSGSNGYSLISDVTADDNSSYIYLTLSSTSSTTIESTFLLEADAAMPSGHITITGARLYSRATKSGNGESASYNCYFAAGTSSGGSSSDAGTSEILGSSYNTVNSTSSSLVDNINTLIETDGIFPTISVRVVTTGSKASGKNASNGYIRVTQIYLELDYEESAYIPDIPSEDPEETYYSLTISSINATTDPKNGTIRVIEGTNETITVYPTDPQLTLALDNGVDITDQLINNIPVNEYTIIEQVPDASYGFELDNSTGYYVSTNNGISNSASVARVNMSFETACLVTFTYINYAEARYDYGIFGNIDSSLSTSYSADSSYKYACKASGDNSSAAKTLTYEVPSGTHYIDIKYIKDNSQNSNDDNLKWKISSIEPTGGGGNYEYILNNITRKHSIVFVFGDVPYYLITSSSSGCRLFPDGQQVKLPDSSYLLTIVPDDINSTVILYDNGVDKTSTLVRTDATDKSGNTVATYAYDILNINEDHELNAGCVGSTPKIYLKKNNTWTQATKVFIKVNDSWVEQNAAIWQAVFDTDMDYVLGG